MDALKLAILFHETYERLAPSFGYETRTETRKFDPTTPNGKLMVAVCGEVLDNVEPVRMSEDVVLIDGKYYRAMSDAECVEFIWGSAKQLHQAGAAGKCPECGYAHEPGGNTCCSR